MEPRVPDTHVARAFVWALVACGPLAFAAAPRGPGPLALASDTDGCKLAAARDARTPCACADTPLAVREVLGLPAPLNGLSAFELERVAGLGPARAAAILREREARGDYAAVDEVARRVRGIGAKTVDRIRPRLFAAGPDPACGGSRGR